MRVLAVLAGGTALCLAVLAVPSAGSPAEPARERALILDEGGVTAVAKRGSAAAKRRGLSPRALRRRIAQQMRYAGGASGIWVDELDPAHRGTLFSRSARKRRVLASNSKIFTTAATLDRFGANGRFHTRLYARGKRSGAEQGILNGDLALIGAGDPALAQASFARRNGLPLTSLRPLARAVKAAGIHRVKGSIIADETIFDSRRSVPQRGITPGPYLSTLSGLSFNAGFSRRGGYARSPARNAGAALARMLEQEGIPVRHGVDVRGTSERLRSRAPLAEVASPTVADLILRTNKVSDNFYAEMLLKRLSATGKRAGTTARGARRAERFARSLGSRVRLVNGSGLTRRNAATPRSVGKLLVRILRRKSLAGPFRRSLSIAAVDGTLAGRMRGTAAAGRCRGKTGTIDGVSVLSGYCPSGGNTVAFSILMNSVDINRAHVAQDRIVAAIARFRRG